MGNIKTLYLCAYGQSRSRYFAEQDMLRGKIALFCGYDEGADIHINLALIEWADRVVILDKDFVRDIEYHAVENLSEELIHNYIEDIPWKFKELYEEWILKWQH